MSTIYWLVVATTVLVCTIVPHIVVPEVNYYLTPQDISEVGPLSRCLISSERPLDRHIIATFDAEMKTLLHRGVSSGKIRSALCREFNRILATQLYSQDLFKDISLSSETRAVLARPSGRRSRVRLNRLLLRDAYPQLAECPNYWVHAPSLRNFMIFGTYKQENLFYVVARAARVTLYVSIIALILGILGSLPLIFCDFHPRTRAVFHPLLNISVYLPRLLILIGAASFLKLQETSRLLMQPDYYLMLLLGGTGAIFLASQTAGHISRLRRELFVEFAYSLGVSSSTVFFRHILRNCTALPLSIVKQLRDNIIFVSVLTFIGVVHLHPLDLGGLIYEYYRSPESFAQGWWILFFPGLALVWLVFLADIMGNRIAESMEKRPEISKV